MTDEKEKAMETEAPLVTPQDKTVLYLSRRSELRLTKKPRYPIRNPVSGVVDGHTPGEYVGFRDGQVRIPKTGTVRMTDTLNAGVFEMDAAEAHEWLAQHPLNGDREEGFWRVDPSAPPVSQEEMRVMMEAALNLDVATLERLIQEEQAGWGRAQILEEAENALVRARSLREQSEQAEIAAQEAAAEGDLTGPAPTAKAKPGPKPKAGNG